MADGRAARAPRGSQPLDGESLLPPLPPAAAQKCTVVILPLPISYTMSTASLSATWPKRVM